MALSLVNSHVTTTQTIGSGDELVIARDGIVSVDGGNGVEKTVDGGFSLHVDGAVYSNWHALLLGGSQSTGYYGNVVVSETGVLRTLGTSLSSTVYVTSNALNIYNSGMIASGWGDAIVYSSGVDWGSFVNFGTVTARDDAVEFHGDYPNTNINTFVAENHGHMQASSHVFHVRYENLNLLNTGTMSSEGIVVQVYALGASSSSRASLQLHNSGTISSSNVGGNAIVGGIGDDDVFNSGDIIGGLFLSDGQNTLENHGSIFGDILLTDGSENDPSTDSVINTGLISGSLRFGRGQDEMENAGEVIGDVNMGGDSDVLSNRGAIQGDIDMGEGGHADRLYNTGLIDGDVVLGGGSDLFVGYGGEVTGFVDMGEGSDRAWVDQDGVEIYGGDGTDYVFARHNLTVIDVEEVVLRGALDAGVTVETSVSPSPSTTVYGNTGNNHIVNIGAGVATFYGRGGDDRLEAGVNGGTIDGGAGHDVLVGNIGDDSLSGTEGNDYLTGELGADTLSGGHGVDTVHGGDGDDRLFGGEEGDLLYGENDNDTVSGGYGNDTAYGGTGNDRVYGGGDDDLLWGQAGDDTVSGGAGDDIGYGGNNNDQMIGNEGRDTLYGDDGDDTLNGGLHDDVLLGGLGLDNMTGGHGYDVFVFLDAAESTDAARDTVLDFLRGEDLIDLSAVSAQTMGFVGNAGFTGGGAASVRYALNVAGNAVVSVDSDGDAVMDMRFVINAQSALDAGDFIL